MRRTFVTLLLALMLLNAVAVASGPVRADEPGSAIQSVIQRQIAAFLANDVHGAYAFASPMIQKKFGDAETFGQMVQLGYPMVWRPSRVEMRELVRTEAGLVQVVLIVDASGRVHEAGYLMKEIDGEWRINGVHVRKRPGVGT